MDTGERRALAALAAVRGVGPASVRAVREAMGPLGELLERPVEAWVGQVALVPSALEGLKEVSTLAEAADRLERALSVHAIRVGYRGEPEYPSRLAEVRDAPEVLFYRGPAGEGPPRRRVALVGSRRPDAGFARWASGLASALAGCGVGVVSGGAIGIDEACHRGALERGESWAFLGSGLDRLSGRLRDLTFSILEAGGSIFSEHPPGVDARRWMFPRRNRLISGASDAVVVVRADADSGALHTVDAAEDQGRLVLAVPGDPGLEVAKGCLSLLAQGRARLCRGAGDVLAAIGLLGVTPGQPPELPPDDPSTLSDEARLVLGALERTPRLWDEVQARVRLPGGVLAAALTELELAGQIRQVAGKRYEKVQ